MPIDLSFHKGLSWNRKGTANFGESTTPESRGSSASWKTGISKSCIFLSPSAFSMDYIEEQVNLSLSYLSEDVKCKVVPYFSGSYKIATKDTPILPPAVPIVGYALDTWKPVINELEYQRFEACYTGSYVEVRRGTTPALMPINECNYTCGTALIPFLKINFSLNWKFDIGGKCVTINYHTGSAKFKGGMKTTITPPIVSISDIHEARVFPNPGSITSANYDNIALIAEAFTFAPMP